HTSHSRDHPIEQSHYPNGLQEVSCMLTRTQAPPFLNGLYGKFVEYGIKYFFPSARLEAITTSSHQSSQRITENPDGASLTLNWLGAQYALDNGQPFSASEHELPKSLGEGLDS